jgi:hypothetical protein
MGRYCLANPKQIAENPPLKAPDYYFYALRMSGFLKIGIAKNLRARMGDYKTHNPAIPKEVIFAAGPESDMRGLESHGWCFVAQSGS